MIKAVEGMEFSNVSNINLQLSNSYETFDSFKSFMSNFNTDSLNKQEDVKEEMYDNNEYSRHEESISKLRTAVNDLKKAYSDYDYDDSAKARAYKNEDIKEKVRKLDAALDDVSNMVKNDSTVSKDELQEVKKLVEEVPKVVLADDKVVYKSKEINKVIKEKVNLDNSNLDNETNNIKVEMTKESNEALEVVESDVPKLEQDEQEQGITSEVLSAIENILFQIKDLVEDNEISKDQLQQIFDILSESGSGEELLKLFNVVGNTNSELKETVDFLNQLFENTLLNFNNTNELKSEFKALDAEEVLSQLVKENGTSEISNLLKQVSNAISKETPLTNEVNYSQVNEESKSLLTNLGNQSLESNSQSANNGFSKEEKILNEIINGKENNVNNKFSVIANSFNGSSNTIVTTTTVVNESSMVTDIIQNIKYMSKEGIDELIVKVNPRELGELIIKIVKDGDMLKAEINASSKETYALLLKNADDIKKYLGEQNIKVQNVEIGLSEDSYKQQSSLANSNGNKENKQFNNKELGSHEDILEEVAEEEEEETLGNINMLV